MAASLKIKKIMAREILDASGRPSLSVKVQIDGGFEASTSFPSDFYKAPFALEEKKDGDKKRFSGEGKLLLIKQLEDFIAPKLIGKKINDQKAIDETLLSLSEDIKGFSSELSFCLSSACAILGAKSASLELFDYLKEQYSLGEALIPTPIFNIFNGGDSGDTNLDFQEFLLIPKKAKASEMIRKGAEVFLELGDVLSESSYDTDTGSEGGYAPDIDSTIEAIELVMSAIIRSGYKPGSDFNLGIDIGSSVLYNPNEEKYIFSLDNSYFYSADLNGLYNEWLRKYPISYLEDPFHENDWRAWRDLTSDLGRDIIIAGDDLFSSNINRFRESLREKASNAIVIKPSQMKTLTEFMACAKLARERNYKIIVSGRSRESIDTFIVDLAVACGADYLKAGSLSRGERVAKYNRLMEIGDLLGK